MATDKTTRVMPEMQMSINSFRQSAYETGVRAIALRAQNLLLMEKGTYPDAMDMGVGIGMYLFESITEDLVILLQSEISGQLREYLPDILVDEVRVERAEEETIERGNTVLNVVITLQRALEGVTSILYQVFNEEDGTTHGEFFI